MVHGIYGLIKRLIIIRCFDSFFPPPPPPLSQPQPYKYVYMKRSHARYAAIDNLKNKIKFQWSMFMKWNVKCGLSNVYWEYLESIGDTICFDCNVNFIFTCSL